MPAGCLLWLVSFFFFFLLGVGNEARRVVRIEQQPVRGNFVVGDAVC